MPDEVAGEQADQHVGFDAVLEAVVDGSQVQVVGLNDAEVAFDVGEVLVAFHHCGGVEASGVDAGAEQPKSSSITRTRSAGHPKPGGSARLSGESENRATTQCLTPTDRTGTTKYEEFLAPVASVLKRFGVQLNWRGVQVDSDSCGACPARCPPGRSIDRLQWSAAIGCSGRCAG